MANVFGFGALWSAAVLAFAACSNSPNSAGDNGGLPGSGDGAVVGTDDSGGIADSAPAASSGSSSGSAMRGGSSSSSSGAGGPSGRSSSGGGGSSGGNGGPVDAGCAASCDQVKRCCPVLSAEAGSLINLCKSAAASCKDSQCMQFLNTFALGLCPP